MDRTHNNSTSADAPAIDLFLCHGGADKDGAKSWLSRLSPRHSKELARVVHFPCSSTKWDIEPGGRLARSSVAGS